LSRTRAGCQIRQVAVLMNQAKPRQHVTSTKRTSPSICSCQQSEPSTNLSFRPSAPS
jgi:hypothetical protein